MVNEVDDVVTTLEEKLRVFSDYYRNLFTSIHPKNESMQTFLNSIEVTCLTQVSRQHWKGKLQWRNLMVHYEL